MKRIIRTRALIGGVDFHIHGLSDGETFDLVAIEIDRGPYAEGLFPFLNDDAKKAIQNAGLQAARETKQ